MIEGQKLWTAIITPMQSDGAVDYGSFEKLIRRQESAGNGVLLIGSTGEGLALDDDEKKGIVEFAAGLKPEIPLMAGVGGMNVNRQKKWVRHCNSLNVDAYLLVTPLYAKPGPHGQFQWFSELLDAAEKPCMLYNIPSRTGISLHLKTAEMLAGHPNFWSIKEASGSVEHFRQYRGAVPSVSLYSGDDSLLPAFKPFGCAGLVSVASNIWPEETKLYVERCLSGDTESLFPLWDRAVKALFSASNPVPVKKLLHKTGHISSSSLRLPLTDKELEDTAELEQIHLEIKKWHKENR